MTILDCGKLGSVRVVLDTNILISACLKPGGLEAQTVRLAQENAFVVCVSSAIWCEYEEVLSREKFHSIGDCASDMLSALRICALSVEAKETLRVAADEDDNRLLECAAAAVASYLVTGNRKHFPAVWENARIVNAREFLTAEFGLVAA